MCNKVIEKIAYKRWQMAGSPHGQDKQIWDDAEKEFQNLYRIAEKLITAIRIAEEKNVEFPPLHGYEVDKTSCLLIDAIVEYL